MFPEDTAFSGRKVLPRGVALKEIVKKIMESEKEIRARIDDAHAESQKIVREAESKSREIVEQGRQKAVIEGQEIIDRMRREAENERKIRLSEVGVSPDEAMKKRGAEIDRAVAMIKDLVTGKNRI